MSIYDRIADSGRNAGAGLNAYVRGRYDVEQDRLARTDRQNQFDLQRADQQNQIQRNAYVQDREHDRKLQADADAHWKDTLELLKYAKPGEEDKIYQARRKDALARQYPGADQAPESFADLGLNFAAPTQGGFTLKPGDIRYNNDGSQVAAAPPKPTAGPALTHAQKKVDEAFAKDYNDLIAQGGLADIEKQTKQLDSVVEYLEDPDTFAATGGVVGLVPKFLRDVLPGLEAGAAAQDSVEEVVQRNLRLVLGAQFTEKEGARLIERAYNPRQSEKENARRVRRLTQQIKMAARAKMKAAAYYEEHGTLQGFKGKTNFTIDDFDVGGHSASGSLERDSNGRVIGSSQIEDLVSKYGNPNPT